MTRDEIHNEVYLYHCAGGHTRSAMAKAKLEQVGFRFVGWEEIYWPDGELLTYKDGNIVYR